MANKPEWVIANLKSGPAMRRALASYAERLAKTDGRHSVEQLRDELLDRAGEMCIRDSACSWYRDELQGNGCGERSGCRIGLGDAQARRLESGRE